MSALSPQNLQGRAAVIWQALVARGVVVVTVLSIATLAIVGVYAETSRQPLDPQEASSRMDALRSELGPPPPVAKPAEPPEFVKGIYVSADVAGSHKTFAGLVDLVDRTELNAMVIDLKDGYGTLTFVPTDPSLAAHIAKKPLIPDLKGFTQPLREKNIWLIARIFVFQDPAYVALHPEVAVKSKATGRVWRDRKGVPWVDPAHKAAWEYTVKIAREAYAGGFDEVQFDYIRFPSDGNMSDIRYPVFNAAKTTKAENMKEFFAYLDQELTVLGVKTSVDLFGMVMWQPETDFGVGQRLDFSAPYFDYISPMVYPSHYPDGWSGYANPAAYPYEVVHKNLLRGQPTIDRLRAENPDARIATIRPWIQDFNLGATYGQDKVRAQMKASVDGKASGWLLWNARNTYTKAALKPEPQPPTK